MTTWRGSIISVVFVPVRNRNWSSKGRKAMLRSILAAIIATVVSAGPALAVCTGGTANNHVSSSNHFGNRGSGCNSSMNVGYGAAASSPSPVGSSTGNKTVIYTTSIATSQLQYYAIV